jgi:hypothetical protein
MIITKTPFRISFVGIGSDLAAFYVLLLSNPFVFDHTAN